MYLEGAGFQSYHCFCQSFNVINMFTFGPPKTNITSWGGQAEPAITLGATELKPALYYPSWKIPPRILHLREPF